MKKVLSLILAVVLVFSMSTVAFAGEATKTCVDCGFTAATAANYNAHILEGGCGICTFCGNGFVKADLENHKYICTKNSVCCDYCGGTFVSQAESDKHLEACKAKYFNIPLYKILSTVENFIKTTDWNNIIYKAVDIIKTVVEKVTPVVSDLLAKIPTE